ncbi:MAG: M56 family metallopeptidase [Bacillota bacterium]
MWGVVAFRLIAPFSFKSIFSLMPRNTSTVPIPHDIIYQQSPQINSGIEVVDSFVNNSLPASTFGASVNPLQIYVEVGAYIWIIGIIALLVYSLVSILILKRQLKSAQLIEKNVFEAKNLKTPFVLGLIKPKIYLPVRLNATERSYILLHEQTHIHRKDHIIKVFAFLTLSVHWFNPLVWIAFMLMSTDMELSCDERVLKQMNNEDIKKPYANSLLSLAAERHILNGSPLAFGEGNVKGRIKNVLNYKRPRFWVVLASIIVLIGVSIALLSNPTGSEPDAGSNKGQIENPEQTYNNVLTFAEYLYTNPLASYNPDGLGYLYRIQENSLSVFDKKTGDAQSVSPLEWNEQNITDSEWKAMFNSATSIPNKSRMRYFSKTIDILSDKYRLFEMDGEIWVAQMNGEEIWCLYSLKPSTVSAELSIQSRKLNHDDPITSFAWEFINKDIANYESNPGVKIIDSKITRIGLIETFDNLADAPIDVYELEYRLLPEDLSKVVLAGGMQTDEEGWLKETSSMGQPLLVVLRNSNSVELVGTLWTAEIGKSGLEPKIKSLLEPTA